MTRTRSPYLPVFNDLHRDLNRLFENVSENEETGRSTWTPRTDIVEFEDRFEIHMDVPGVARDRINLSFEADTLEVSGDRDPDGKSEGRAYYRCECASGPFSRKFRFPSLISAGNISANLKDGVLTISVPKAEEAKARTIEIR